MVSLLVNGQPLEKNKCICPHTLEPEHALAAPVLPMVRQFEYARDQTRPIHVHIPLDAARINGSRSTR